MVEPTGYTALDLIGFTDRGNYNPITNYVKNDLVHYGGSIWRILIDDTVGQTPAEGIYYTVFVKEPTNMVEKIMAPLEENPSLHAWTVGRQIINNDNLYEVIAPIAIGDNLVAYEDDPANANVKLAPPIETQVLAIKNEADKTEDMIAPSESNPAAASHSVGTQIIVDNILYDVTSPIAASDALIAYPTAGYNIKPAASVSSQIQALSNQADDMNNILGAKNLIPNNGVDSANDGITWHVNNDGSITVTGQLVSSKNSTYFDVYENAIPFPTDKNYKVSGLPTSMTLGDYKIQLYDDVDYRTYPLLVEEGETLYHPSATVTTILYRIRIYTHDDLGVSGVTFYPMIRPASIKDDTYVPYAMTNRELTAVAASMKDVTVADVSSSFTGITSGTVNMIKHGKLRQLQFDNVSFAGDASFPTLVTADRPKAVSFGTLTITSDNSSGRIWLRVNGTFGTGNVLGKTVMGALTWIVS